MIRRIQEEDLEEVLEVIQKSFLTVAKEFHITRENGARFTAYSMSVERLRQQYEEEKRPMYGYYVEGRLIGYCSIAHINDSDFELCNLCVLEEYRHEKVGDQLFCHACQEGRKLGYKRMIIGVINENERVKRWYTAHGAVLVDTKKHDFLPFTSGAMVKML